MALTVDDLADVQSALWDAQHKWFNIGVRLKLNVPDLPAIDSEPGLALEDKLMRMILSWLKRGQRCTWRALVEALKHPTVNLPELARQIKTPSESDEMVGGDERADDDAVHDTSTVVTSKKRATSADLKESSGIEVLAEVSVRVTSEEQSFVWKGYGLRLYIPQGSLPAGHTHCWIKIREVAIPDQVQFPIGGRPVSAFYWLSSDLEEEFSKHLSLEIQHCAMPNVVGELEMVTATTTSHIQFQPLEGGHFSQFGSYGTIKLCHFSLWSTVWKSIKSLFSNPPLTYYGRIYYREKKISRCEAHVAITQNLEACFMAVENQLDVERGSGASTSVEFEEGKSSISLDIPDEAKRAEGWKKEGWQIRAMNAPVIDKQMMDKYTPGMLFHTCHLKVKWCVDGPVTKPLILKLILKGAKEPRNFLILECGEREYCSSKSGGQIHEQRRPTFCGRPDLIILKKFPHPSGDINIMQEVAPQYQHLGNILLQSPDGTRVQGIEKSKFHDEKDVVYEIFRQWLQEDAAATWNKLVQCLKDVNLSPVAKKINSCLMY